MKSVRRVEGPDYPHPMQRFFAGWRNNRASRYAAQGPGKGAAKRRAVLTIVNNEPFFFPIWLRYYSRFFAARDIYVLDDGSDDGSLDGAEADGRFVRTVVGEGEFNQARFQAVMSHHQARLLAAGYDLVVTCDVDEILIPTPERGELGRYLDEFEEPFVNPLGYELLHLPDREPDLRPELAILDQRGFWFANDAYDKPAISAEPIEWSPGFHARADGATNHDPDLRLLHLHRVDYRACMDRHRQRRRGRWGREDLARGWASYYRLGSRRARDRWYFEQSGFEDDGIEMVVQQIPASWRGRF